MLGCWKQYKPLFKVSWKPKKYKNKCAQQINWNLNTFEIWYNWTFECISVTESFMDMLSNLQTDLQSTNSTKIWWLFISSLTKPGDCPTSISFIWVAKNFTSCIQCCSVWDECNIKLSPQTKFAPSCHWIKQGNILFQNLLDTRGSFPSCFSFHT